METKIANIQDLLRLEGLTIKSNSIVEYKEINKYNGCLDFVDIMTGDVFSFIYLSAPFNECWATNEESFQAYQKNIQITVKL